MAYVPKPGVEEEPPAPIRRRGPARNRARAGVRFRLMATWLRLVPPLALLIPLAANARFR